MDRTDNDVRIYAFKLDYEDENKKYIDGVNQIEVYGLFNENWEIIKKTYQSETEFIFEKKDKTTVTLDRTDPINTETLEAWEKIWQAFKEQFENDRTRLPSWMQDKSKEEIDEEIKTLAKQRYSNSLEDNEKSKMLEIQQLYGQVKNEKIRKLLDMLQGSSTSIKDVEVSIKGEIQGIYIIHPNGFVGHKIKSIFDFIGDVQAALGIKGGVVFIREFIGYENDEKDTKQFDYKTQNTFFYFCGNREFEPAKVEQVEKEFTRMIDTNKMIHIAENVNYVEIEI